MTPSVMDLASNALRGVIIAPPGRKLVIADLRNIEGRVLPWMAGEKWKLDAFRAFDADPKNKALDLYNIAYAKSFGIDPSDVDPGSQRQIGKVEELMLGYEGGVGAFLTGAATYGFDIEEMAAGAFDTLPADVAEEAREFLEWMRKKKRSTFGLSDQAFIVCDSFKRLWRRANLRTVDMWKDLKAAAVCAVENPGTTVGSGVVKMGCVGAWLRIRLPSGRYLCYPNPRVGEDGTLSYMGVNQYTRKWSRIKTYGGKLAENIDQAISRDVLAANMPRAEAAGYELVLTVHDEYLTETPDDERFSARELVEIMSTNPDWAVGLPLSAAGFETYRYRKD